MEVEGCREGKGRRGEERGGRGREQKEERERDRKGWMDPVCIFKFSLA